MTKFNIENTNEYKALLNNRAVAGLVRNRISQQSINNYFNWVKEKYPTVVASLDKLLKEKEQNLNGAINLQHGETIRALIFDILETSRKEIRGQSRQRLNQLFTQPMPLDFQTADKKAIDSLKISENDNRYFYNTSDVVFLVNGLIEEVFFGIIPRELEKELNKEPKIQLSELPAEWNTKRNELLSAICAESLGQIRELSDLEPVEKAINEKYQELVTIIQGVRNTKLESLKVPTCDKPQHQQLETDNTKLKQEKTALEQLKKSEFEAVRKVNISWHNATMIDRGDKEKLLGENWDEELLKKGTPENVVKEQNRLIKLIEDRVEIEKQNQTNFEQEIQATIKKAEDFNAGSSLWDPKELLKELEDYRDKWGISGQATPAQWNALRKNRVNLNREIANFSVTVSRNEAINEIKDKLGNFKSDELLAKREQSNFENTLRQLRTIKEINEFENSVIENISVARWVRTELIEIVNNINKILQENESQENQSIVVDEERCFELYTDLAKYRDSSIDSPNPLAQARRISYNRQSTTLRRLLFDLLAEVRKPALNRLTEINKKAIEKVSGEQTLKAIKQKFEHYQELINAVGLRELRNRSREIEFEREVHQLTHQLKLTTQQTSQIIQNNPPSN